MLIIYLRRKKNGRMWACLTWSYVILVIVLSVLKNATFRTFYVEYGKLCRLLSLGLVYWVGYTISNESKAFVYNIGGEIKTLAVVICIVGIIISVACSICMYNNSTRFYGMSFDEAAAISIAIIIAGPLLSWVGALFVYGFGELIEKTTIIADHVTKPEKEKDIAE